jgi:hypothetical protein
VVSCRLILHSKKVIAKTVQQGAMDQQIKYKSAKLTRTQKKWRPKQVSTST